MLEAERTAAIDYVWSGLEASAEKAASTPSPPARTKQESVLEGRTQPGPGGGTRWDLKAPFYYSFL